VPTMEVHTAVPEEESSFESQQRMAQVVLTLVLISVPIIVLVLYFTLRSPRSTPAPAPAPAPATATEPAAEPSPPPTPTILPTPPAAAPVTPEAANEAPLTMTLDVHPTADCWVKLVVDGKTAISRVMHAGENEIREVHDTAVIDVGDAGAFAFSINGRPGKPLGVSGQVRNARITKETFTQYVQ